MKNPSTIVLGTDVLDGNAGVVARDAVRVERQSLGTQDDDRLRNGVRDPTKLFLILQQLDLSTFEVIDVGARPIPPDDVANVVAERFDADQEPPIDAVAASQTSLDLVRLPRGEANTPPVHQPREVVGMEGDLPSPSGGLLLGQTRVVLPRLVEELVGAIREVAPREHRDRVDDPAELRVCCGCRALGTLQVIDVGTGPIPPEDTAALVAQRLDADQEPSMDAVGAPQTAFDLARVPRGEESTPPLDRHGEIVGMEGDLPSPPGGLLLRQARVALPSLVDELVGTVREGAEREHRDRVEDPAQWRV